MREFRAIYTVSASWDSPCAMRFTGLTYCRRPRHSGQTLDAGPFVCQHLRTLSYPSPCVVALIGEDFGSKQYAMIRGVHAAVGSRRTRICATFRAQGLPMEAIRPRSSSMPARPYMPRLSRLI